MTLMSSMMKTMMREEMGKIRKWGNREGGI
jgi:hypothetical protein